VTDWWVVLPTEQRTHQFKEWWLSLSREPQAKPGWSAAAMRCPGNCGPPWYRPASHPDQVEVSTGQIAMTMPFELYGLIHR